MIRKHIGLQTIGRMVTLRPISQSQLKRSDYFALQYGGCVRGKVQVELGVPAWRKWH